MASGKKEKKIKYGNLTSDFANLTSHQLRTPLSGMKWLLELLQKSNTGNLNKKQKEFLEKIYYSNERMIALVNDLLEVSRIEQGVSRLYLQPTDLTIIIRDIIRNKGQAIKHKHLKVIFTTEEEPFPVVQTEPNKIRQVLYNLITNAITYIHDDGKVSIDLKVKGRNVLCSVADTGVGIPEDQQSLVFGKFFRGANVIQFESIGTGLGLYIARSFIEASGGKIWFESTEGRGTTFYFTLPIVK